MKRKFKKTENGNSEKFLSVSEKADLERSFMEDDRKQKLIDKEKNNDSSYDQKMTRKFLERMRKPGQSHFSKKDFFLYRIMQEEIKIFGFRQSHLNVIEFSILAMIEAEIAKFQSVEKFVIISIYEFRNEQDYLSYGGVLKGSPYIPLKDGEAGFAKETENEN